MARVCVDGVYFDIDGSGNLTFKPASVGIQQMVVFTASGTFNKASFPGVRKVHVRAVGGGGGGAGAEGIGGAVAGSGGSGGNYAESLLDASALGASETVAIGAAGLGGVGNVPGGNGGQTSFGSSVVAPGGFGGNAGMPQGTGEWTVQGASQNTGGTGQVVTTGTPGGHGHRSVDSTTQTYPGGNSGGGYGAGGGGIVYYGGGGDATGYGGAGSGGASSGGANRGGNGTPGVVILTLHF